MLALFVAASIAILVLLFMIARRSRANAVPKQPPSNTLPVPPQSTRRSTGTQRYADEQGLHLPDLGGDCPEQVRVKSQSEPGVSYIVSLAQYTCTCPDWQRLRGGFPKNDLRRICKHIHSLLTSTGYSASLDEFTRAFLRGLPGGVPADSHIVRADIPEQTVVFVFRKGHAWIDVVTLGRRAKRNPILRFGYNASEERWSYGRAPRNAKMIRSAIRELGVDKVATAET